MAQLPLIALGRLPFVKQNQALGNVVFWLGLMSGFPLLAIAYVSPPLRLLLSTSLSLRRVNQKKKGGEGKGTRRADSLTRFGFSLLPSSRVFGRVFPNGSLSSCIEDLFALHTPHLFSHLSSSFPSLYQY